MKDVHLVGDIWDGGFSMPEPECLCCPVVVIDSLACHDNVESPVAVSDVDGDVLWESESEELEKDKATKIIGKHKFPWYHKGKY